MKRDKNVEIFQSYQRVKNIQRYNSGLDFELAKELTHLKKDKNFRKLMGDEKFSWKAFVAQPELQPLNISKANRLVCIYDNFVIRLGVPEQDLKGIDTHSLHRLATVVDKDTVEEWLEKAKNLSRSDLYREINFGNVKETECEHEWKYKQERKCIKCGVKELIKKDE